LVENPTTNPRGPSNFDWVLAVGFFNPVVDVSGKRQRMLDRDRGAKKRGWGEGYSRGEKREMEG